MYDAAEETDREMIYDLPSGGKVGHGAVPGVPDEAPARAEAAEVSEGGGLTGDSIPGRAGRRRSSGMICTMRMNRMVSCSSVKRRNLTEKPLRGEPCSGYIHKA